MGGEAIARRPYRVVEVTSRREVKEAKCGDLREIRWGDLGMTRHSVQEHSWPH